MPNSLPPIIVPLLEKVRTRIPARDVPLDFWQIESGPKILDGFMSLASELMLSHLSEDEVPPGYVVLSYLFSWEADCQADGWGAFGNISSDDFERVCRYFEEEVDLAPEAKSLRHQMNVYEQDPDNYEALVAAAELHSHPLSGDLDRLEYLTQYFCDHADRLLYADA
jgi:hypothetical protein